MIRALVVWLAVALPVAAQDLPAQDLPALYRVTGVAADDVLNIRAAPDAGAAILGTLPPAATDIEVVGQSPDRRWGIVNTGEASGYAALRFLQRQPAPDWFSLQTPLRCAGTEPFWSLTLPPQLDALYSTPQGDTLLPVLTRWPGTDPARVAGLATGDGGFITLAPAQCSDGMSDRRFGIAATLFVTATNSPVTQTGCCTLQP